MDKSGRLEMLVRVVDQGSLVAASRSLGLTSSAVSRGLADLEKTLGVTLLHRSTRRIQLTEDGVQVYERALDILARLQELESAVARRTQRVSGTLRVGMPVPIGRHILWPRLALFLSRYPEVQLDCKPIQDPKAMQTENFDVMLMAGEPPPSRLVARRLALGRPGIYAAPEYLRRFGEPKRSDRSGGDGRCGWQWRRRHQSRYQPHSGRCHYGQWPSGEPQRTRRSRCASLPGLPRAVDAGARLRVELQARRRHQHSTRHAAGRHARPRRADCRRDGGRRRHSDGLLRSCPDRERQAAPLAARLGMHRWLQRLCAAPARCQCCAANQGLSRFRAGVV